MADDERLRRIVSCLPGLKERGQLCRGKYSGIDPGSVEPPFTDRGAGMRPSSGTTGTPVMIPHTRRDVEGRTEMFERRYRWPGSRKQTERRSLLDTASGPPAQGPRPEQDGPGGCGCGPGFPRMGTLVGRTGDMVKGANILPGRIDEILGRAENDSSEY